MINIRDWEVAKFLRFVRARRAACEEQRKSEMTDTQRHEAVRRCQRREATGLSPMATEPEIQAAEEAQRRRRAVGLPLDAPDADLLAKERAAEAERRRRAVGLPLDAPEADLWAKERAAEDARREQARLRQLEERRREEERRRYVPASPPCRNWSSSSSSSSGYSRDSGRGGGCFAGDGVVAVGPRGNSTRRVDSLRAGDTVYSPSLEREVTVTATTVSREKQVCTLNGLRISRKHPVKLGPQSDWELPVDLCEGKVLHLSGEGATVHNFVLSEGSTLEVNGMSVLTLGDDAAAGKTPAHPFYGTSAVVDALKAKPSWPEVKW